MRLFRSSSRSRDFYIRLTMSRISKASLPTKSDLINEERFCKRFSTLALFTKDRRKRLQVCLPIAARVG